MPDAAIKLMTEDQPAVREVRLLLSPTQVEHVVRAASGIGAGEAGLFGVLLAFSNSGKELALTDLTRDPPLKNPSISQSLVLGMLVLTQFPTDGSELSVKEISESTGLSPTTAYRYLHTLKMIGLLEQNASTRKYLLSFEARDR
jgi:IclR helix-turn-helix domain